MMKKFLSAFLCLLMILGFAGCSNPVEESKNDLENAKQELEETYEKYGWVEEETVDTLVAKFNTEIMDGGIGTPASDDYMVIENDTYWFGLTEDISFYVKPLECTEDKNTDIADISAVRMIKANFNEDTLIDYAKKLIKANNYDFTDEEIDDFIREAKEISADGQMSNNGKGISVGLYESDEFYEYQVRRLYK